MSSNNNNNSAHSDPLLRSPNRFGMRTHSPATMSASQPPAQPNLQNPQQQQPQNSSAAASPADMNSRVPSQFMTPGAGAPPPGSAHLHNLLRQQQRTSAAGRRTKYLLVVGGVCSSLGKGVTTSIIGALLRGVGFRVSAIKIDPYVNVDAGLMSPFEHGEVYVLDDGGEADLDLGNYERWMGLKLGRDHNVTTGKVYQHLIDKERSGLFLGKTVQVVPHFTDHVQDHIKRVAQIPTDDSGEKPDICLIELGGTVGDIESAPFMEALRQLRFSLPPEDFCVALVTYLPNMGGSQKTKPTQHSVKTLMSLGMLADFLVCRCEDELGDDAKRKLSQLCGIKPKYIFSAHNVASSMYELPLQFFNQHVIDAVLHKFVLMPVRYDTPGAGAVKKPAAAGLAFPSEPAGGGDGDGDGAPFQLPPPAAGGGAAASPGGVGGGGASSPSRSSSSATFSPTQQQQQQQQQSNLLHEPASFPTVEEWQTFCDRLVNPKKTVRIAFAGKYVRGGSDAYFSVLQTFEHCCLQLQVKLDVNMLDPELLEVTETEPDEQKREDARKVRRMLETMDGIFVPGGFGLRGFRGKQEAAGIARANKVPFFGVCYGFQAALVEMARSVLKLTDADSEETDKESVSQHHIVRYMPDIDRRFMGATMRLGGKPVFIAEPPQTLENQVPSAAATTTAAESNNDNNSSASCSGGSQSQQQQQENFPSLQQPSMLSRLYGGAESVVERHRHRYEFNRKYLEQFRTLANVRFTASSDAAYGNDVRVEAFELPTEMHPFFLACQYHPEFSSTAYDPAPPFLAFVAAAAKMPVPELFLQRPNSRRVFVAADGSVAGGGAATA